MKYFILTFFIIILPVCVLSNTIINLAGEIRVPLLEGWLAPDSLTVDYPYQIINREQSAELLIFKSIISEDEIITNKDELKISVDGVIDEIILQLPDVKLLTNTGFFDDNRVSFVLEFTSFDSLTQEVIFHRLKGIIYQHPLGHQILFTLWAKTNESSRNLLMSELAFMMDEFSYYGEAEPHIFIGETGNLKFYALLFVLIMIIIFLFVRTRSQLKNIKHSDSYHYWQCECGRENHNDHNTCHRCGKAAPSKNI